MGTPHGVYLLVQLRTSALNGTLDNDFDRWRKERQRSENASKLDA